MRFALQKDRHSAGAIRPALLAMCSLFGLGSAAVAASNPAPSAHSSSSVLNANFAIADFDGDRKPDLATVEVAKSGSFARTEYSIRFELTAGTTQVFGVTAPAGGLQILARDVNGDDALDLLVSTTWQHTQVAVLLNDGHGKFTLAEPGAFPAAVSVCETLWNFRAALVCETAALVSAPNSTGNLRKSHGLPGLPTTRRGYPVRDLAARVGLVFFTRRGRAPPAFVLHA